ncbi:MAG TPA: glycosyltransferase family 2 protein [Actinomycetota bacterium]|nr:glycosyltransferase family 2 protein [Actinomycetota bacterium]
MTPGTGAVTGGRPLVSVVVPTRDAARTVARCLASVRAQTWPALELLVVDNWSRDGTWEVAARLADVALRAGPERSAQRNLGIERAAGEWVLWVDADMVLATDAVERSLAAARAAGAEAVFLPEASTGSGFWARCRALERRCYAGEPRIEAPRLVRADVLGRVGRFEAANTGTEDAALRNRLLAGGVRLAWADTVVMHDEGHLRLGTVLRKRFYYGRSLPDYRRAHPGAAAAQARATLAAWWRHRRLLAADPAHAAGLLVLRACEAAAWAGGAVAGRRR